MKLGTITGNGIQMLHIKFDPTSHTISLIDLKYETRLHLTVRFKKAFGPHRLPSLIFANLHIVKVGYNMKPISFLF